MSASRGLLRMGQALGAVFVVSAGAAVFGVMEARAELDFDLWCQQDKRHPVERCMERRPDDVAEFEAYRRTVERYQNDYDRERAARVEQQREVRERDDIRPAHEMGR